MPQEGTVILEGIELYIRLVWLFVFIITFLMLLLCCLYLSMRRAQEREAQNLAFSHLAIEGLETERRRISRELHDTVLPLVQDPALSAMIRSICMELMPPDFTRLSFKDSLAGLCVQFARRTGIECACSIEKEIDFSLISVENQLHLYRMVQESFTNIEKHSGTSRAFLVIRRYRHSASGGILVCVSDEGVGLQNLRKVDEGLGMRGMRQRAAILGAKIDFVSESGNGLMVRMEVSTPPEDLPKFNYGVLSWLRNPALPLLKITPLCARGWLLGLPEPAAGW